VITEPVEADARGLLRGWGGLGRRAFECQEVDLREVGQAAEVWQYLAADKRGAEPVVRDVEDARTYLQLTCASF